MEMGRLVANGEGLERRCRVCTNKQSVSGGNSTLSICRGSKMGKDSEKGIV